MFSSHTAIRFLSDRCSAPIMTDAFRCIFYVIPQISLFFLPACTGIYLHGERSTDQRRKDGTVPKPSLLERYFHRPLHSSFDLIDIVAYHSQFGASKTPPQYATERWMEKPWQDASNRLQVFRRRPTQRVRTACFRITLYIDWDKPL